MAMTEMRKPEAPKKPDLDTPEVDSTLGRRRFLRWGIYAVGAGVAGVLAVPVVSTFIAPATKGGANAEVRGAVGEVAQLAQIQNRFELITIPPLDYTDVFKPAKLENKSVFVKALKSNPTTAEDFLVLDQTCTHAGCSVTYDDAANVFRCPCHNAEYDQTGKNTKVAPKPLGKYTANIEDGKLTINVFQTFA
jgi:menaquinol-cytochrome c reductase iron-sulfur subunit